MMLGGHISPSPPLSYAPIFPDEKVSPIMKLALSLVIVTKSVDFPKILFILSSKKVTSSGN